MRSQGDLTPADIINQARTDVAGLAEEPSGSSVLDGAPLPGASGPVRTTTASTREEHLKRATGSFSAAAITGKTQNPRLLKQQAEQRAKEAKAEADALARAMSASGASAPSADAPSSSEEGAEDRKPATKRPSVAGKRAASPARNAAGAQSKTGFGSGSLGAPLAEDAEGFGIGAAAESSAAEKDAFGADQAARFDAQVGADAGAASGAGAAVSSKPSVKGARAASSAKTEDQRRTSVAHKRSEAGRARVVVGAVMAVLLCLVIAVVAMFSVFRWFASDDALDMQGTWYISGTDVPIIITEDSIVLNDEVSYAYALDTDAKIVGFTFSYLEGGGHYRFSLDRQQLAIMDGTFDFWSTLTEDFDWTTQALLGELYGTKLSPAGDANVTLLSRVSATEQAALDAKAQEQALAGQDASSSNAATAGDAAASSNAATAGDVAASSSASSSGDAASAAAE